MGVKLSDVVAAKKIALSDLSKKRVAIDGYIVLYQFLTSIRMSDGSLLTDFKGRPVSHLKGLLSRTSRLVGEGIMPVFVFDGKPHPLKMATLAERRARKEVAKEEYQEALEAGDLVTAKLKAAQTSAVTRDMVEQAKTLLGFMGIPVVQAPGEGEAQASHMARKGDVFACASQDFDSLLFGAPNLIRNLTMTGRRKLPGQNRFVNVEPEIINMQEALASLGLTHPQLIDMGLLIGTDFNEGVKGVGPKTALKLIKEHGSAEAALKAKGVEMLNLDEVRGIFKTPNVTDDYKLSWGMTDDVKLKEYLCGEFGFSQEGVDSSLENLKRFRDLVTQKNLDDWF